MIDLVCPFPVIIWSWPTVISTHLSAPTYSAFPSITKINWPGSLQSGRSSPLLLTAQLVPTAVLPSSVGSLPSLWVTLVSIKCCNCPSMFPWWCFCAGYCPNSLPVFAENNLTNCLCSMCAVPCAHFFLNPLHLGSYFHYSPKLFLSKSPSS